ncbi:MAG: SUMF1/EgtB/PvdO family nonheme iron enzyme [Gemmataceae bacterium]
MSWPAQAADPPGPPPTREQVLQQFVKELVPITPGQEKFPARFTMGSTGEAPDNEKPARVVQVTQPFAMSKYEVTQELYEAIMGNNPSRWKGRRNSVEKVSWDEANEFCEKLTAELRQRQLIGNQDVIRLPSEAEWEYCCRAGTTTEYSFGDDVAKLTDYAWFRGNSKGEDPPVGVKKPNPWGLYDMHGYVWEWCLDAWIPDYQDAPATPEARDVPGAKERVVRGGSWAHPPSQCRSAFRHHVVADTRHDAIGFRCVKATAPNQRHGNADWPQFRGPRRDGVSTATGLRMSWPPEGPPVVWRKKVGEGYSAPVSAGDRLIFFHRVGDEEIVDCLQADTGKTVWTHAYPTAYEDLYGKGDGPRSTPLIADGRVYTLGAEGHLLCLDLATGKKVWDSALKEHYELLPSFFGVGTSPLLEGDGLLINLGAKGAGILAFDKNTGKEVWRATDHEASYSSPVAVTIDGERRVLFLTREGIVMLEPRTGKVLHQQRFRSRLGPSVNAAVPVVVGALVFFSAEYGTGAIVLRLGPDKLAEVWSSGQSLSNHYNTSVHHDGHLYGIHGRQEGGAAQLRCVELKTGKVLWSQEQFGCASLILVEGHLLALNEKGELLLIEATPTGYREKARAALLTSPCRADIALAQGRLYARDPETLICVDLRK